MLKPFNIVNTLQPWLISDPLIKTHGRIRIWDSVLCAIHSEGDLTHRGGDRPKCDIFPASLAFATVEPTGQHIFILWNKSVDDTEEGLTFNCSSRKYSYSTHNYPWRHDGLAVISILYFQSEGRWFEPASSLPLYILKKPDPTDL